MSELDYERGSHAAWLSVLRQAISELGPSSPQANAERWRVERQEALSILRQVCRYFGDNDWEDDLHLGDVIEKHLWRNLEKAERER